ncbi:sialic acid-binding Ig-like lectin 15 isoform X2 [Hypanus sabinus]|uniref:sialic acid-binding Ig-like lectin 15 isoform X2 n=1 Tax=Hypanus sabinus TaxID=79690 RepID=UPI0028C50332|nr:sialic acid-binding Ig-like lectin 15 isoform X2 [Hypanus sabinus]
MGFLPVLWISPIFHRHTDQGLHRNGWSLERPDVVTWSVESPDMVIGREGKPVVLFCTFTHPHHGYRGNISVSWREEKMGKWFLNYTNYPSGNGFASWVHESAGERYQLLGSPRQNDVSIIIRSLRPCDDHTQYTCLVELQVHGNETAQNFSQTLLMVTGGFKATSVIGKRGDSARLLCSFSPLETKVTSITVLWMKGNPWKGSILFNQTRFSSASPPYTITVTEGGRYELVGDPEQGNASIRVTDLRMNDTGGYFCYVWVRNSTWETVIQDETGLQVIVPATILELSLVTDDVTGESLVCRAEGEPPASITWIGPGSNALPLNSSEMRFTRDPERHQIVGELFRPRTGGSYSCVAENELGRDTREIDLSATDNSYSNFIIGMLCLIPLIKFLLLLITGIILFIKIKEN